MHVYVYHVCAYGGQVRTSDPLELELQVIVSCRVIVGDGIQVL